MSSSRYPAPDERRCTKIKRNGERCPAYTIIGSDRCQSPKHRRRNKSLARMKDVYYRNASKELGEVLKEYASEGADEKLSLCAEIDVQRVLTERALRLWDSARQLDDPDKESLVATAAKLVSDGLHSVASLVRTAAQTRALSAGTVGVEGMDYVVSQMFKAAEDSISDPRERDAFIARIKKVQLPRSASGESDKAKMIREALKEADGLIPNADEGGTDVEAATPTEDPSSLDQKEET